MSGPIRTIHIDIEGGWGGSSRSLFELVSRFDRNKILPIIVHRQEGPVTSMYDAIGVPTFHVPEIGSYVPRRDKPFKNLVASIPRLACLGRAADRIATIASDHHAQAIHLNYEGLFLLARKINSRLNLPIVGHSRALLPKSAWGRWLVKSLSEQVDHMFFISPHEAERWEELGGGEVANNDVLWNIARTPLPRKPFNDPPEILYLGNIDPSKGTDRLLDIALELERRKAPLAVITAYGQARANPVFADKLEQRRRDEKLEARIEFRGHVSDVAPILVRAAALIRPSRENDPWGRDVIEATSAGVPVLATGSFEGVIENGRNGYLFDPYDAGAIADNLIQLLSDQQKWKALSRAGRLLGQEKFAGREQVDRFYAVSEQLVAAKGKLA